jgi:DNA ligase-associated metallophosphoesterase
MIEIVLQNETLQLYPERAAFWKRAGTLLIADTHWGKASTMRSAGIPIPGGTTSADMERMSRLIETTGAERIVFLGDVIHARSGRSVKTLDEIARWRTRHPKLELLLVRGNHDRGAGDPPAELRVRCVNAPLIEAPFAFQHFPAPSPDGYALGGHTHPAVRIRGRAGEGATLPCFYFTPAHGTLPAFGSLTGCAIVRPSPEDRIYGIADDEVVEIR